MGPEDINLASIELAERTTFVRTSLSASFLSWTWFGFWISYVPAVDTP